jgi:hypothetical protein
MTPTNSVLVINILFLLLLANGTPVIAKKLLGSRLAYPIDAGKKFFDGLPLFGVWCRTNWLLNSDRHSVCDRVASR